MPSFSDGTTQIKRRALRRFYEPLLLLSAIDQIRAVRTKPDVDTESSSANHRKLRRSFADGIAYISSYDKGPNHVTAAALEKTSDGFIIWLAANAGVEEKVVRFLDSVLHDILSAVSGHGANNRERLSTMLLEEVLTKTIDFNQPRLQAYYKLIASYATGCLPALGEARVTSHVEETPPVAVLVQTERWLTRNFLAIEKPNISMVDLQSLVRKCHQQG